MGSKSLVAAAVGVAVGVAAALLLVPKPTPLTTWGVTVDPGTGLPSPSTLTMTNKDVVHWANGTGPQKDLYIETEQQIFASSVYQATTKRYRVRCNGAVCDSGAVVGTLPAMPLGGYKYWQGLADPGAPAITWYDGRIIINH